VDLIRVQKVTGGTLVGAGDVTPLGLKYRSDRVVPGDVFFCVPGFRHDGHEFAKDAVNRGAVALVVGHEVPGLGVPQLVVGDVREALARSAAEFYGNPSSDLQIIGITGTNGKTTTTYLCDSVLRQHGMKTGLIGTVETRIGDQRAEAGRTTPESADLQELLDAMRTHGVRGVSMEVSSHAIDLHRVDAVHFEVAAFTNLTQDHLDYHHTIEEYFSVKRRLFTDLDVTHRVVNIDDPMGAVLARDLTDVITVGTHASALVRATDLALDAEGSTFTLHVAEEPVPVRLPLAGAFNVSNALVAAGCAYALAVDLEVIVRGLESAPQVPGRLELVDEGQAFSVYVDYAHTPDSLEKAIAAVRRVTRGRVLVVFGAGGDRDPDKRGPMGTAAGSAADHVIITSDNPRSEDPVGIILQIEDGVRTSGVSYEIEVDRRAAIARAVCQASDGDAVLIAGKGHEDYQLFADRTVHFDDREVAREELRARC